MARFRRRPVQPTASRYSVLASVFAMSAVLLVLVTTQRGIADGVSALFVGATDDGSGETAPSRPTVRLGIQSVDLVTDIAHISVHRAVDRARESVTQQ